MSDEFLGIDVGYGLTKTFNTDNKVVFPTAVVASSVNPMFSDSLVIEVDGDPYLVGKEAVHHTGAGEVRTVSFLGSPEWLAVLTAAILRHGFQSNAFENPSLTIGVPPRSFTPGMANRLKEVIAKSKVHCNQKRISLNKLKVDVIPQATAIFFAYLTEHPEDIDRNTIVVDLGYLTLDLVAFWEGRYLQESSESHTLGISILLDTIGKRFFQIHNAVLDRFAAYDLLINRQIELFNQTVTLPDLDTIVRRYVKQVCQTIEIFMTKFSFPVHRGIIAGGGAGLLTTNGNGLMNRFMVVTDPIMANAKGYWRYAGDSHESV